MSACARCGRENPEGARFCNACGAALAAEAPAAVRKTVTVLSFDLAREHARRRRAQEGGHGSRPQCARRAGLAGPAAEERSRRSEPSTAPGDVVSQALWRSVRGKAPARRGEAEEAERLSAEAVEHAE